MLKLIILGVSKVNSFANVSIHPMLKLIIKFYSIFNKFICFNTSHVKVNLIYLIHQYYWITVSIHPMLKLITTCIRQMICIHGFNTSHVKVNPTYFLHSIQYTIPDSPVFINVFKIFTSHRAICQKNLENHRNATVFADSRNFALIGG